MLESLQKIVSKKRKLDEATALNITTINEQQVGSRAALNGAISEDTKRVIDLSIGEESSYAQQTSPVKISPPRDLTKRQVQLTHIDEDSSCREFDAIANAVSVQSSQQPIDVDMSQQCADDPLEVDSKSQADEVSSMSSYSVESSRSKSIGSMTSE